jgi:hypothetical protein
MERDICYQDLNWAIKRGFEAELNLELCRNQAAKPTP